MTCLKCDRCLSTYDANYLTINFNGKGGFNKMTLTTTDKQNFTFDLCDECLSKLENFLNEPRDNGLLGM